MSSRATRFERDGFLRFPFSSALKRWAEAAAVAGAAAMEDPRHAHWWRHGRTWFVGVDALPNLPDGAVPGGPPLAGEAIDFLRDALGFRGPWHQAQVSACFPGYPQRDESESEAQHRFRRQRDAAHVDGLHGEGPERRRYLREYHDFILGLPLTEASAGAAPLVVWKGSHVIMQTVFTAALQSLAPERWGEIDFTDLYQQTRKQVFDTCERIVLPAAPGEATLVHRFALHGVAPWGEGAHASGQGRMIAYFRPETTDKLKWLTSPL
ncbi:hypothetical protein [Aestuariivirga sp.]|uniref:hypothetical protein n=1 Tax=Aestuariivirga sp. TaxID=2650926 RepID=UPI0039E5BCD6